MGDVRAVFRLPLLNISYYKDILCEYGGILAIANKSSSIHKTPWIGFQSWRASGRKVLIICCSFLSFLIMKMVTVFFCFGLNINLDFGYVSSLSHFPLL